MSFTAHSASGLDANRLMLRQGDLHRLMGRWDDALALFEKIMTTSSLRLDAALLRLQTLLEAGRFDQGIEEADALVSQHHSCGKAHLFRARLLHKAGFHDCAAMAYRISLEFLDPPLAEHYLEAARVYILVPDQGHQGALDLIATGARNLGRDMELEVGALEIELECGRFDAAFMRLRKLLATQRGQRRFNEQQICKRLLNHCESLSRAQKQHCSEMIAMMDQLRLYVQPTNNHYLPTTEDFFSTTY